MDAKQEREGPTAAFDRSVWRVVGTPLAPALGSGPLDGCGVAVKDLFAVAGHRVGGGVPAFLTGQPPRPASAACVTALQRAGAHLVGIAQTDEFAYSNAGRNVHYGAAPNPAAPGRLGGGSSSGPAAAVALGQAEIGERRKPAVKAMTSPQPSAAALIRRRLPIRIRPDR
jgi:hypothetical protein